MFNWSGLRGRGLLRAFSQRGCICFSFLPAVACRGGHILEACSSADARALQGEDTLPTFLPAPLILLAKFTVSIFPGMLSSLWQPRVHAELWNRAGEASLWEICFYSNPWALLKQKQKNKNKNKELEGPRPAGPRRHFTTCEATLPYMAPCLPAAANQRAVPRHVMCHEGSTAISLFRKSLLPPQSTLPCDACQMFLQNVSSRLAFVHKVISVGKKSLRTWAWCILYVKWISLLGQRPRALHTGWVRRALLCWETGGPTHS